MGCMRADAVLSVPSVHGPRKGSAALGAAAQGWGVVPGCPPPESDALPLL